jgi:hypothetical protein
MTVSSMTKKMMAKMIIDKEENKIKKKINILYLSIISIETY